MAKGMLRRNFLKVAGLGAVSLVGCKEHNIGPLHVVYLEEPVEKWENVDHVIDNTLEGGFSFNFRDIKGGGLMFRDLREINGETHALDAQGYTFSSRLGDLEKQFAITSLRRNERGFAFNVIENPVSVVFDRIGERRKVVLDEKEYIFTLNDVFVGDLPSPVFDVNRFIVGFRNGLGESDDVYMSLKLQPYLDKGVIELILGRHYFQSCNDSGFDKQFIGLEHIIEVEGNNRRKLINANYYNRKVQEDAYFRIGAVYDVNNGIILLNAADKIRVADAEPKNFASLPSVYPRREEIELREKDKGREIIHHVSKARGLENNFLFVFNPPLEARIDTADYNRGIRFVPEFFNIIFGDEKNYMMRYVAFDARKIPKTSQPSVLGRWYSPVKGLLTEILEEPEELMLNLGEEKIVNIKGEDYIIRLKKLQQIDGYFPAFDFNFEIEKEGKKEEGLVKVLNHGYANRILDINIDPDVAYYYGKFDYEVNKGLQRFFVSKNKFSSTLDFAGDNRFSSLRKILIPDYEGKIKVLRPVDDGINGGVYIVDIVPTGKAIYQQVTLANRFNGEIQDSGMSDFAFRAEVELGFDSYEGSKRKSDSTAYVVVPRRRFDYSDQIKNGYVLRLKSIEKVFVGKLY